MRSKIEEKIIDARCAYKDHNSSLICIMDYSEQTNKKRGIESSDTAPNDIEPFIVNNSTEPLPVTFCCFGDNVRISEDTEDRKHCEGVLFPTTNSDDTWITFIELKYCKKKYLGQALQEAKEQLLSTVKLFRQECIIDNKQLAHLIYSAPKYTILTPFENWVKTDYAELTKLRKEQKIILRGVNEISIINNQRIKV